MLSRKINIIVALILFAGRFFSSAQAQSFTARASQTTVQVGQGFQIEYSVNANGSNFTPPSFSGFNVIGSMQGTSMNIGPSGSTSTITYTFILSANSEGTFTIGPATINCGGKTVSSNSLTIKVGGSSQSSALPQPAGAKGGNASPAASATSGLGNSLFVRLVPSKTKAYIGEEITTTLKIYFRVDFESNPQISEFPDYAGFYTEDLSQNTKNQAGTKRETVGGLPYNVIEFPQKIIFPQHAGKIKIGSFSMQFIVDQAVKSNSFIAQFFGSYKRVPCNVKSDPVIIDVQLLPKTEKGTSGAVGNFTLKGELDKNKVKANEAINLTVTISGSGNLKLIDTLPVRFPPDFDHYDPKLTDHFTINTSGMSGTRTYNYLLVPRHEGSYKIAPIEFTYFNPDKKTYITLSIPEMAVEVAKGDNNSSSVTVSGPVNKEDVKLLSSDIRYIHAGHEEFYRIDDFFLYSFPFLAGIFTPILLFVGFVIGRRRYIEMNKDALAVKKRKATGMAKKRLKIAHQSIAKGNKEVFYTELLSALNGYFSNKFSIPLAELSRDSISANLIRKEVKPETLQMVNKALDDCEFARYAPATVTGNLEEVYTSAVKLITLLEDEIS